MVAKPEYILAKYVPDIYRNEPRNIGVILWSQWGVSARFLGERSGTIHAGSIPNWVDSHIAYQEWIGSWRAILLKKEIVRPQRASAADPSFLEVLQKTGRENYILGDRGLVLDEVIKEDLPALLSFLFNTLVDDSDKEVEKSRLQIEQVCNKIIRKTRASNSGALFRDKDIYCKIGQGVMEDFKFHYYIQNGGEKPKRLYQRVTLNTRTARSTVDATAWQFENVVSEGFIEKENTAVLVMPSEEEKEQAWCQKALAVLGSRTRVLDLNSQAAVFEAELNEIDKSCLTIDA